MPSDWIRVALVVFCASFVRGAFGFGEALVAMPFLTLLLGIRTTAPLVALIAASSAIVMLAHEWQQIQLRRAWPLTVAALVGMPLGIVVLKFVPESNARFGLGITVVAFASYSLLKPDLFQLKSDRWGSLFALVAGVLSGAYNTGGPPLVIFGTMRGWSPEEFRGYLQGIFLPMGVMLIVLHTTAGTIGATVLHYWVIAIPFSMSATLLGLRVSRHIPREMFIPMIHVLLLAIGAFLLT